MGISLVFLNFFQIIILIILFLFIFLEIGQIEGHRKKIKKSQKFYGRVSKYHFALLIILILSRE